MIDEPESDKVRRAKLRTEMTHDLRRGGFDLGPSGSRFGIDVVEVKGHQRRAPRLKVRGKPEHVAQREFWRARREARKAERIVSIEKRLLKRDYDTGRLSSPARRKERLDDLGQKMNVLIDRAGLAADARERLTELQKKRRSK